MTRLRHPFLIIFALMLAVSVAHLSCEKERPTETVIRPDPTYYSDSIMVIDTAGQAHALTEWIGHQPVVLSFWEPWCVWCKRFDPVLIQVYNTLRAEGFEIIGLSSSASQQQIIDHMVATGIPWPEMHIEAEDRVKLGVSAYPTLLFYCADSLMVGPSRGYLDYDEALRRFRHFLDACESHN